MARAVSLFHETAPDELKTMRLGGGTALAAMWHHRMSTDIDLACGETTFDVLRADGSPLQVALLRLHSEGRIPRPTFAARMIAWEYPDTGEVSIVRRLGAGEELLSGETDDITGVPFVAPRGILHTTCRREWKAARPRLLRSRVCVPPRTRRDHMGDGAIGRRPTDYRRTHDGGRIGVSAPDHRRSSAAPQPLPEGRARPMAGVRVDASRPIDCPGPFLSLILLISFVTKTTSYE